MRLMPCLRSALLLGSAFAAGLTASAQVTAPAAPPARIGSTIFKFEDLAVKPSGVGERRDVARNPTATMQEFECHISTLNPNLASHPPHTHPQEELIILRDGELDVHINGTNTRIGPGTLFFFASNDPHAVQNRGTTPATYFVFNFSTAATVARRGQPRVDDQPGRLGSTIFHWDKLEAKPTKTGLRRNITDLPTLTLANFECHVTTLNAGEAPHAAHRHPDEEIILVKEGRLEVTLNGRTETVGPGAILFFSSNDEHGVKNAGTTAASYYVMRLKTEATPVKG
jgi:quercetin dioxygenase-like cupin family protein